ncbi:MAG: sigma-70 family RNA polymerase sigma factor [Chitinophagaceae bacterium]|nr:sigma-70 family RNA polymerase sigma factor [Chitinophagaceae bacterium]
MHSREVFIGIIQENESLIYKVAKLYTNSREDEEDLYQEIVYQLWKSFPAFRAEARLSTWMYRIALNTAIAHLNKAKRKGNHLPIDEGLLNRTDSTDNLKEEQAKILYDRIKQLDTIEKAIILLYLEGKSYEEIASITGFTATNVGTRLARIKQKIKSQIKK